MGPAWKEPTSPYVSNKLHPALRAFPSPASLSDSLSSPTLNFALNDTESYLAHLTPRDGPLEAARIVPTEPDDIRTQPVMTPPINQTTEPDMNTLVGGALAPTHAMPPPRPPPKSRPGLRLPSFEALGIAAPHPDRFGGLDGTLSSAAREAMQDSLSIPHEDSDLLTALKTVKIGPWSGSMFQNPLDEQPAGRTLLSPLHHYIDTLTPPAEVGYPAWNSMVRITTAMDSPATDAGSGAPGADHTPVATEAATTGLPSNLTTDPTGVDEPRPWIEGAIDVLIDNLRTTPAGVNSLKILSHALPSPSPTGHIFPEVISAIRSSVTSPMIWINVFHAIPGRFNLQDLPRSPPSTPGPAVGGEDYFTEKVFDSAVSVADYQEDLSQLPRSPRPVVPPSSVDVSIVERYIPPSTSNEFAEMFNPDGPSILVDRLVELSPNNGSLTFIYPTRTGAETFLREYLGPILDPALRSMSVIQGFSTELNRTLGNMVSAHRLPDHETFHRRVAALCARLTQRASAAERFHGRRPKLALSYSSKQYVHLTRDAWARDWWLKQEKPRIRDMVAKYAREAQTRPSNEHIDRPKTGTELLKDLFDDFERRARFLPQEPEQGIEVSVFVITRTS